MRVNFKHLVAYDFKLLAMSTVEEEIEGSCLPSAKPHFLFQPEKERGSIRTSSPRRRRREG